MMTPTMKMKTIMMTMMKTGDIPPPTWVFVAGVPPKDPWPAGFTRQMHLISLKAAHWDVNDKGDEDDDS